MQVVEMMMFIGVNHLAVISAAPLQTAHDLCRSGKWSASVAAQVGTWPASLLLLAIAAGANTQTAFDQLFISTMTTSRRGPCAPCTRIFSMSAVRLEPLITQANEFWASIPCRDALPSAVSRSGTIWRTWATAMWHGATTDAPRPPHAAVTKMDPVCAINASTRVTVAWEASLGAPSLDQRTARLLSAPSIRRRSEGWS